MKPVSVFAARQYGASKAVYVELALKDRFKKDNIDSTDFVPQSGTPIRVLTECPIPPEPQFALPKEENIPFKCFRLIDPQNTETLK